MTSQSLMARICGGIGALAACSGLALGQTSPTASSTAELPDPFVDATERGLVRLERAHLSEMLDLNPGHAIDLHNETVNDRRAARVVRAYAYFRGAEWLRLAGDRQLGGLITPEQFEDTADRSFGPGRRTRRLAEYDPELVEATIDSLRALDSSPLREPSTNARPFTRSRDYVTQIGERLDQSGSAVERDRLRDAWQEARAQGNEAQASEIRRQWIQLRNSSNRSRDIQRFALTILRYRLQDRDDMADRFERALGIRNSRQGRVLTQRVDNATSNSVTTSALYTKVRERLLQLVERSSGEEQVRLTQLEQNLDARVAGSANETAGQANALQFVLRLPYYRVVLLTESPRRN